MSNQIFPVIGATQVTIVAPIPVPTQDVSDGTPGQPVPTTALQIAGSDGTDLQAVSTDTSGNVNTNVVNAPVVHVEGHAGGVVDGAPGAAVPANAIQVAGSDGTDLRALLTDSSGRQEVVGAAASGAAVTGNPVLVAGSDGTDARTLLTDNTGQLKVLVENGSAIAVSGTVTAEIEGHAGGVLDAVVGAAIPANAVLIGGNEAGNIEPLLLDASGFLKVNVAAGSSGNAAASATGSAVPADADYLGASDGTDLQGLLVESATHPNLRVALYNGAVEAVVDAQGGVKVSGEAASGSAVTGNPVLVAGQDGTDARTLLTDNTGQLKVLVEGGTGATVTAEIEGHAGGVLDAVVGAAVPANAVQIGGSDGTDLRAISTDTSGRVINVGAAASGAGVAGNPVLVAGQDGTDARTILTDTTGQVKVLVEGGTGIPVTNSTAASFKTESILLDGAGTNLGTVKAASTQAATTDTSLVVQLNPEQPALTTALNTSDAANGPVTPGTVAGKSELQGGVVATSAAAGTVGQQMAVQMDVAGCVRVNPAGQTGSYTSTHPSNPPVNTALTITVPAGQKWLFKALFFQITSGTSGTTAEVEVLDASGNLLTLIAAGAAQGTSVTDNYTVAPGLPLSAVTPFTIPVPEFALGPGFQIVVTASSLTGGDQIKNASVNYIMYND